MRKKTRADPTTRKNPKTSPAAQIAGSLACPIEFAPLVDNTKAFRSEHKQGLPRDCYSSEYGLMMTVKESELLSKDSASFVKLCTIGVDVMGSETDPSALLLALKTLPLPAGVKLLIIGSESFRNESLPHSFAPAAEVIQMEENPLLALRRKRNSSMSVGLRLLKEEKIDAFVSAGNTGALVSSAKMILSTLKGILRPALLTLMPTKKNPVAVLDVGGNVQVKSTHLKQFALIGAAYQEARGVENPIVGLLNIGSEPLKGTSELRLAYDELKNMKTSFRFAGNIEGKSAFDGDVDVLVTDGFTGNIFLKTAEGIANLILDKINPSGADMKKFHSLHYTEYPGALLAGVQGVVIKCHSYSTPSAFAKAVLGAATLSQDNFIQLLHNKLTDALS